MLTVEVSERRPSTFVRKGSTNAPIIEDVCLEETYLVDQKRLQLASGRFGSSVVAQHRASKRTICLKLFAKTTVRQLDVLREYNYSFFLSPHQNIVDTYEGVYSSTSPSSGHFLFFVQECCPHSNLKELVESTSAGLDEQLVKRVLLQLLSALEFMHAEDLVHRDVQARNVLLFDPNGLRVKLSEFGLARRTETMEKRFDKCSAYHAPELCECLQKESYAVDKSIDVWAVGILTHYALRRRFPWEKASFTCKPYREWEEWLSGKNLKLPAKWTRFTEKMVKFYKKTLCPRAKDRCTIKDIKKYISKDKWIREQKSMSDEDLCASSSHFESLKKSLTVVVDHEQRSLTDRPSSKRKSIIQSWLSTTINTMSQISEQVVSASE